MTKEELNELNKKRDKQLRWIYDKYLKSGSLFIETSELIDDNLKDEEKIQRKKELISINDTLSREGLIKRITGDGTCVQLEQKGIEKVEDSINNPEELTKDFSTPPVQNFTFNAPVGSFQQGNQNVANVQQGGIRNTQQTGSFNVDELISKIKELIESVKESDLSVADKITVESDLQAIQKFAEIEVTPEVSQKVESRLIGVKDILSTTSDLVSLGQVVIPMIIHFFRIVN